MNNISKKTFKNIAIKIIALVFIFSSITSTMTPVNAVDSPECNKDYLSSQDIYTYYPCENTCSETSTGSSAVTQLTGQNNGEKIYNFWIAAGLAPQQAAGVTGSMRAEGGFSPFRQEMSQSWPAGGWGIAQFTAGQRDAATAFVSGAVGADLFNQYYKNDFGGAVTESSGYIPDGVPQDVNDKFLLGELNYLLDHIKSLQPNNIRRGDYAADFSRNVDEGVTLYDYLKTIAGAGEAAQAWTYLYEYPGDIKATSLVRATYAEDIYQLYSGGGSGTEKCGDTTSGNSMTLEQAKAFMDNYSLIANGDPNGDKQYLSGACNTLIDNCVTFVSYFVKKYTDITFVSNDGGLVVGSILAANPGLQSGTIPKPGAIFATREGKTLCSDGKPCGHTGIILGVNEKDNKVIVGEAAWCQPDATGAHEYSLSEWSDGTHTYAYTDSHIIKDLK